jgi:signal transduction histidine kinase
MHRARWVVLGLALSIAPAGPAAAQAWRRLFEQPQLTTFIFLSGLFISLALWAILERQTIARRFRKILQTKSIEDELLDFAPAGYIILRRGGHCYCSDRLREWLGFTAPIRHLDDLLAGEGKPGFDAKNFDKLKHYILQITKRRLPFPCLLNHALGEEELFVYGKPLRTHDRNDAVILLWVTQGAGAGPAKARPARTAEDATSESFELYLEAQADTLNGLSTSVAIFGPDQSLRFCNQAFQALWGVGENWIDTIPTHGEFLDKMREDRRLPEQADFASWRRHILSYYSVLKEPVEEMWHLPDGKTLRVITQPYLLGGLIIFFEDVTDRLDLERSYNTLIAVQRETLDHLYEAVAVIGSDGRIGLFNPTFAATWGLKPEDLRGQPHVSEVLEMCKPLLAAEERVWKGFKNRVLGYIINREQTTGRWRLTTGKVLEYIIVPLPDGASLLTLSDVTDSVRIETALRDKNQALEAADKLRSEFVAGISSDLRLPLNSIAHFAEILDKEYFGKLNDNQKNYLAWILSSSRQVRAFIDDVMDLAVIEAGQVTLQTAEFDVGKAVEVAVGEVQAKPHQKHFRFEIKINDTTGTAHGDEHRLRHALVNILEDAIERVPPGGRIAVSTKGSRDRADISFTFRNAELPLFFQGEVAGVTEPAPQPADERNFIGLRLSLARSILKLHGGEVAYDLRPDKDSSVVCTISRTFSKRQARPDAADAPAPGPQV